MIEFWPPDARLHTDGRVWRWILHTRRDGGIACHRSRSLLIATLSLWLWVRKARADRLSATAPAEWPAEAVGEPRTFPATQTEGSGT